MAAKAVLARKGRMRQDFIFVRVDVTVGWLDREGTRATSMVYGRSLSACTPDKGS